MNGPGSPNRDLPSPYTQRLLTASPARLAHWAPVLRYPQHEMKKMVYWWQENGTDLEEEK